MMSLRQTEINVVFKFSIYKECWLIVIMFIFKNRNHSPIYINLVNSKKVSGCTLTFFIVKTFKLLSILSIDYFCIIQV